MENKNKLKTQVNVLIVIIGILLLLSFVSAIGVTSDYSNENHANIGPGETKTLNILRLMNGGETIKIKVELVDGAGVASYTGPSEVEVKSGARAEIPIKVIIPQGTPEETKYDLTFKFTDVASSEGGMLNFGKSSTIITSIYVKKAPQPPVTTAPPVEKPAANYTWYIIVLVIIIIIAIVAYFLFRNKKN